ncbi:MAG: hypothetical protein ABSF33_11635 [Acidimicrobiales bacterium]
MTTTSQAPSAAPPTRTTAPERARRREAARWLRAHRGLVILLVIPFLVFGLPELFGRVFLDGDNFLQNFPMRVLVGRDLRQWTLPLWDPYLSSGTPLLGGFNAGAAYPATWLTAVLPVFTAWTFTLALTYDVALAGMYLFLRRQSISTTGALFGAATFAFAGYMSAQIVHIDLVAGAAWLPWTLTAVHALTGSPAGDGLPAGGSAGFRGTTRLWVAVLATSLGLSVLAGSAEAIIDSGVLVGIYAVGRLVTMGYFERANRRPLAAAVLSMVAGVAGGLALGAAQWLTGLEFLSQSQRAQSSYAFFVSGSLPVRLATLFASPFVLGGNQGGPGPYVGAYNFEEVTSYVGILALIAACSLFLKRFRTRPEARHWWIWYVIAAVGLLSAFGGQTFFGHVLYLIPGINSERLTNRNILLVDFSMAVLLAWWVHLLFDGKGKTEPAGDTGDTGDTGIRPRRTKGRRAEIVVTCLPLAFIGALCLFLWVGGVQLDRLLGAQSPVTTATRIRVSLLVTAGALIAGAATWIVLVERRLPAHRLRRLLVAVLVVDLVVFDWYVVHPPTTEARAQALGPMSTTLRTQVGDARFIIYDPDQFETTQLYQLGQTDLNLYAPLPSGQGYTALTQGTYYDVTGAHFQEDLDPTTLAGPTWDDLNVSTLLSLPGYFVTPLPRPAPGPTVPLTDAVQFPAHPDAYTSAPTPVARSYPLSGRASRTWYFGGVLSVGSFTVPLLGGRPGDLRAGLVTAAGGTRWLPASDVAAVRAGGHTSLRVSLGPKVRAAGLIVGTAASGPATVGTPTAFTAQTGEVALDGRMQYGVTTPHWVFTGMLGAFAVFHDPDARGWAWVRAPRGGPAASGSRAATRAPGVDGGQQVTVHATSSVVLERSEAWTSGWRATVQPLSPSSGHPAAGPARAATVVRVGISQGVTLPGRGDYLVTFSYLPDSAPVGLALSAVAGLGLLIWAASVAVRRRRRAGRSGVGPAVVGPPDEVSPA